MQVVASANGLYTATYTVPTFFPGVGQQYTVTVTYNVPCELRSWGCVGLTPFCVSAPAFVANLTCSTSQNGAIQYGVATVPGATFHARSARLTLHSVACSLGRCWCVSVDADHRQVVPCVPLRRHRRKQPHLQRSVRARGQGDGPSRG